MREIKFRAWEPDMRKYYYFDLYTLYCINPMRVKMPSKGEDNAMILFNINHRPFEQFTGLRDKNGREIYEGDIIKIHHVRLVSDGPIHKPRIAELKWLEDDCGFRLVGPDVKSTNPDLYPISHLEVIGNIHENPELLK